MTRPELKTITGEDLAAQAMQESLNQCFGSKYAEMDGERNAKQIAHANATPIRVQMHGVALYSMLQEEGMLKDGARVVDIGSGNGEKLCEYLSNAGVQAVEVDFVEPSGQFSDLENNVGKLNESQVKASVHNENVSEALDRMEREGKTYDVITLNLSFQYFPDKFQVIKRLLALLNKENPNACIEIVLTGKEHGQEFVPIYNEARDRAGFKEKLSDWDTGMIQNETAFAAVVATLGGVCTADNLTRSKRIYGNPHEILTNREKVQSALLYGGLVEDQVERFRGELLSVIDERGVNGETIHVVRLHITSKNNY